MTLFSIFTVLISNFISPEPTNHIPVNQFIENFGEEGVELLRKAEQDYMPSYSIEHIDDALRIKGDITFSMYEEISSYLEESPIKRFVITSPGGDIDAGIKIGRLMHKNSIDLEIIGHCISSCANYLFTAAANKKIHDGAVVVWHGNSEQKDWREFDFCGRTVSSFDGMPMTEEEIYELKTLSAQKEWKDRRINEKDFFQHIGIDGYIARVGQEPVFLGNFTMSVMDMYKFGVKNISAPSGYASADYCQQAIKSFPSLICMSVTEEHLKYEKARRDLGEICSEDGMLVINSEGET